jgi:hypothetical protein
MSSRGMGFLPISKGSKGFFFWSKHVSCCPLYRKATEAALTRVKSRLGKQKQLAGRTGL